ncbi:hypothetical protein Patl1_03747 [Pistacia atlantica]|uniref:Uncharacterized protein n=1 Tax=Pistacia atlantica TaxID=434234 RepID=A0ACC1BR09_9ROSI|nr:hypothetical protein Patl1_03747 [Pistacia atlantica]
MASSSISSSLRLFTTKSILTPKPRKNLSFFYKPLNFTNISLSPSLVCRSSASSSLQPLEQLPPKLQDIIQALPVRAGTQSKVWVRAYFDEQKNVVFEADSDSVLTKGLAALLVQGLSHRPVEEIVKVSPDFVVLLGLQQSLTPSRNNGFLNMLKLMQKKALELFLEAEKAKGSVQGSNSGAKIESSGKDSILNDDNGKISNLEGTVESSVEMNEKLEELGSRGMRIREKLEKELRPVELEVEDISYQHAGHAGVKGSDGETHFNVKVVSEEFEGKSLVKRHRLIYGLLQDELQSGLHALSIVAKIPSEVEGR